MLPICNLVQFVIICCDSQCCQPITECGTQQNRTEQNKKIEQIKINNVAPINEIDKMANRDSMCVCDRYTKRRAVTYLNKSVMINAQFVLRKKSSTAAKFNNKNRFESASLSSSTSTPQRHTYTLNRLFFIAEIAHFCLC